MYLGFTKNKVLLVFLLLGCVFASLALSQVSFEKVYMEGLEDAETPEPTTPAPRAKKLKNRKKRSNTKTTSNTNCSNFKSKTCNPPKAKDLIKPKKLFNYIKCIGKKFQMYDKFINCSIKKSIPTLPPSTNTPISVPT